MGRTALILIFVVAVILRFAFLDRMSFWADELWSIECAHPKKSSGEIIYHNLTYPVQSEPPAQLSSMPLFTLLLHGWMKAAPLKEGGYPSETWIRFLPALISLFSLILLIRLFVFPWQGPVSIGVFLVFCLSSFYLYFSREARPYGFLLLMTLLSSWAFLGFFEKDRKFDSIIYSLSILIGVLINPFMWLVFISQCVYLIILRNKNRLCRIFRLVIPSIIIYLFYTPIILKHFKIHERPPLFSFFVVKKMAGVFFHTTLGFNFPTNIVPERYSVFLQDPIFLLSSVIILFVCGLSLIKWPRICKEDRLGLLSLILVVVPVTIVFFIYPRRLGPKALVIMAPFFHYLLIKGIFFRGASHFAKATGIIFLVMVTFFGFRFLSFKVNPYVPEDWRGLARELESSDRDKTAIFIHEGELGRFRYYLRELTSAEILRYKFVDGEIVIPQDARETIRVKGFNKILFIENKLRCYSTEPQGEEISLEKLSLGKTVEVKAFGQRIDLLKGTR